MATKKKPAPKIAPKTTATTTKDAAATGSQAEFEAFLPRAKALPASAIVPMRADLQLALHNVTVGVENVLGERARAAKLPETELGALETLPELALAVIFADTQIERTAPPSDVRNSLAKARELRALLLTTADGLALAGLLPKGKVDAIRKGRGGLDAAHDCVELAALYRKHAATIRGKHAVTAAQVEECANVGTKLLTELKARRARSKGAGPADGTELRDRLWTLFLERADALFRAGAYLFGRDAIDAKVPPLQAHRGSKKKPAPPA